MGINCYKCSNPDVVGFAKFGEVTIFLCEKCAEYVMLNGFPFSKGENDEWGR